MIVLQHCTPHTHSNNMLQAVHNRVGFLFCKVMPPISYKQVHNNMLLLQHCTPHTHSDYILFMVDRSLTNQNHKLADIPFGSDNL